MRYVIAAFPPATLLHFRGASARKRCPHSTDLVTSVRAETILRPAIPFLPFPAEAKAKKFAAARLSRRVPHPVQREMCSAARDSPDPRKLFPAPLAAFQNQEHAQAAPACQPSPLSPKRPSRCFWGGRSGWCEEAHCYLDPTSLACGPANYSVGYWCSVCCLWFPWFRSAAWWPDPDRWRLESTLPDDRGSRCSAVRFELSNWLRLKRPCPVDRCLDCLRLVAPFLAWSAEKCVPNCCRCYCWYRFGPLRPSSARIPR